MFIAWLIGALVVGAINALLAFVVFMFTTVVGLVLLGVFVVCLIGNLMTPSDDEEEDDDWEG